MRTNLDRRMQQCSYNQQTMEIVSWNAPHRHGIALLLVMVALTSATVVSAAYICSRQSEPNISINVEKGLAARLSAETGIDLAEAIMQCDTIDWRAKQVNGVLLDSYDFGGGSITINVTDMDGNVPTTATEDVIVSAQGVSDGLKQFAKAQVHSPKVATAIDPTLSDFALFANSSIQIGDSYVDRWAESPNCQLGTTIKFGINSTTSGAVKFTGSSSLIDTVVYKRADASATLIQNSCGSTADCDTVDITSNQSIPIPTAPPPDLTGLSAALHPNATVGSGTVTLTANNIYNSIVVQGAAVLTTDAAGRREYVTGNLTVQTTGTINIDKDTDIIIGGNLTVQSGGSINVTNGAQLRIWVGGNVVVNNAALGLPPTLTDALRANPKAGVSFYSDPSKCMVYKLPGSGAGGLWEFDNHGWGCCVFYAPTVNIEVENGSSLFGAATGETIMMAADAMVHYDPCLDTYNGYSNPSSGLFSASKTLNSSIVGSLTSLTPSLITSLTPATPSIPSAAPGAPTPRSQKVAKCNKQMGQKPLGCWYWRGFYENIN